MEQKQPRGIRNNNPGNIRWGENWLGLKQDGKVDLTEIGTLTVFIKAIIRHENGMQPYSNETIQKGIAFL